MPTGYLFWTRPVHWYLIGMERRSGSMEVITPLNVSCMLNIPLDEVEEVMTDMDLQY